MATVGHGPVYARGLKLGMTGNDVWALNRALLAGGYLKGVTKPAAKFDEHTRRGVVRLQTAKKLKPVTGKFGPKSFKALYTNYDKFGAALTQKTWIALHKTHTTSSRQAKQAQAMKNMKYRRDKRSQIHYTQSSKRMQGVKSKMRPVPPKLSIWEDCSSECTYEDWLVGWPDPNGLGYSGQGYTGTMIRHGKLVANPQIGDKVFYGASRWDINHVAEYIGGGMVHSHGSESGPEPHPINYRPVRQIRRYS